MKTVYNPSTNTLQKIPTVYDGQINYHLLPTYIHVADGFYDYQRTEPVYDSNTQKAVFVGYEIEPTTNIATEMWDIVNLTQQEIIDKIPLEDRRITPAQGMAVLSQMGLLPTVEGMVNQLNDPIMNIFWTRSVFWDKFSTPIQTIAAQLNIDLDVFFEQAKNVNI